MRRHLRTTDDRGSAMAMVIGIMVVVTLAMATLAAAVGQTTRQTVSSRAHIQAQGAADAGIDRVLQWMDGKTYGELQTAGTCLPGIAPFSVDDATVTVAAQWTPRDANGCLPAGAGNGRLVVTATADQPGGLPAMSGSRAVVAEFSVSTPPSPLDNAIFGEGSVTLSNNLKVVDSVDGANDANVYTNSASGFTCTEHALVEGSLTAVYGNLFMRNGCTVNGSVWVSGDIEFSASGVTVRGDMYTASTSANAVRSNNTSIVVEGNVLANGGVSLAGTKVGTPANGSSVWSGSGQVRFSQNATVNGSVYAALGVDAQQGTTVTRDVVAWSGGFVSDNGGSQIGGNVRVSGVYKNGNNGRMPAGSLCQNGAAGCAAGRPGAPLSWNPAEADIPPGVLNNAFDAVQMPPRVAFPRIASNVTPAGDPLQKWRDAQWDVRTPSTPAQCTDEMAKLRSGYDVKTLVDLGLCPGQLWLDNATIVLRNDLAIFSDRGFASQNDLKVTVPGGGTHDLMWIVPDDAAGVAWTPVAGGAATPSCTSPAGNIAINKATTAAGVRWFFYTPCDVSIQNGIGTSSSPVVGQIYAGGKVQLNGNASYLQMPPADGQGARIAIPSLDGGAVVPTAPANPALAGRYDVPVTAP